MLRHPALKVLLGLVLVAGVGYTLWLGLSDPRIWQFEWHLQPLPVGIGFLMMEARDFMQTDIVLLGLVIYALLGLLSDLLLRLAERRALTWRRGLKAS